jgi:hypothetical protein
VAGLQARRVRRPPALLGPVADGARLLGSSRLARSASSALNIRITTRRPGLTSRAASATRRLRGLGDDRHPLAELAQGPDDGRLSRSRPQTTVVPATPRIVGMDPGLCATCRHARVVEGAHSRFWLCERSRTDPRFPRYPRLPVLACPGHEPPPGQEEGAASPTDGVDGGAPLCQDDVRRSRSRLPPGCRG